MRQTIKLFLTLLLIIYINSSWITCQTNIPYLSKNIHKDLTLNEFKLKTSTNPSGNFNKPFFHIFNDSAINKKTVYASIGIGISVLGGQYTTALNIIPEFHPHFKLSVGFSIFFTTSSNSSTMFSLNLTPYYVIKLNKNSNIDIGTAITYLNRNIIFTPSFKFDSFVQENVKLGIELKYPVLSGLDIIFLPFLILNLSFRI